jgi:hypothetical protein
MTTIVNSTNEISPTVDEDMWPTLNNPGASPIPPKEQKVTKQVVWNDVGEPIDQEDWELLADDDDDDDKEGKEAHNSNETKRETPVVQVVNRKILRHAQSSPNLHSNFDMEVVMEDDDDDASGSFAMVSGPGSVMSMASNFSFRDAILSPGAAASGSTEDEQAAGAALKIRQARPRVKPRFVVKKPMKRCIKSTGDLKSLVIQEDEEVMGSSDAMEFYHRKALGVQTRKNGLKLRPDEAKRKQMIMQKKGLQRSESRE